MIPRYIKTFQKGGLEGKIRRAETLMSPCTLCPRHCRAHREANETGFCKAGKAATVASFAPHFGEEPPLVGHGGSGTIFFSYCNLKCVFCQNHEISILGLGSDMGEAEIASAMLFLKRAGCSNINLVTPTHVVPQILKALAVAAEKGLDLPLVYNSSGYESLETLAILRDVVDIYMPDFKFMDPKAALQYCRAENYPETAKAAILEMQDQVGDLVTDSKGVACSGLLVRHLVMPGRIREAGQILAFLKEKVSGNVHVNLMSQYRPMGTAFQLPDLSRPISPGEFREALNLARELGLTLIR